MKRLRVKRVRLGLREIVDGADAAPPPHDGGLLGAGLLSIREVVKAGVRVVMAQALVLAAVGRNEMRGPDERSPAVRADAVEEPLRIGIVLRVEFVGPLVREPAAVHHVDSAGEAGGGKFGRVVLRRLLIHAVEEDFDPVVPLRKREKDVRRHPAVEPHVRLRDGEIGVAERFSRLHRLDRPDVRVEQQTAAAELVAERLFAPHVAPGARNEHRGRGVPVDAQVDARRIVGAVGLVLPVAPAPAPPAFAGQKVDFRKKDRFRRIVHEIPFRRHPASARHRAEAADGAKYKRSPSPCQHGLRTAVGQI